MTRHQLSLALLLLLCTRAMAQTSLWTSSTLPRTQEANDTTSVSIGLKFYSTVPGSITAIRFYKGPRNTGAHIGTLWSSTGAKLATVTFSSETASGWQQASFASPVPINANTPYVISYLAPKGYYAQDQRYDWSTLTAGPLRPSGTSPGVFAYGTVPQFPTGAWKSSNYWVDVVFVPTTVSPPPATFSISGNAARAGATLTLSGAASRFVTTDSAGNYTFSGLANGSYSVTPTQSGYAFTPATIPVSITEASVTGVNFTGVRHTTFWPNSAVPGTPQAGDTSSVTLGMAFSSDVPGTVIGVRFYKASGNGGTHVGDLWSSTGTRLASVTFSGETASGWQQVNFQSPPKIAANTGYVISYFAPNGSYAIDQNYAWSNVSASPLRVSGSAPGVFAYGSTPLFPSSTWSGSNYWVDVVFAPDSIVTAPPPPPPATYTITGRVSGSAATLTLSGASSAATATDSNGNYSFPGLANGSYVISASQSGYTFTPALAALTINGASITGVNFTGSAVPQPVSHSVTLNWVASTSTDLQGYNLYRADVAGGAYMKLNVSPILATNYVDASVASGRIYYYAATAIGSNNSESEHSNQATAVVPSP